MSKLVSILMPAKNVASYIDDCIQSIIDQSYQEWELIVVNDHSTDKTSEHLVHFASLDKRIQIHNSKGQGIIEALRLAYSKARGAYITRMDADDVMPKQKIASLLSALEDMKSVSTGLVSYFSKKGIGDGYKKYAEWLNANLLSESPFEDIYKECVIPSPCWMMHRATLDKIGAFYSGTYPEDYDLCFRMHKHRLKVKTVRDVLHHWRDYPERSSRTDDHYSDNRFLALKVAYFAELEYEKGESIYLWGSGKKGKSIAKLLQELDIAFHWITNNEKKIGHIIYSIKLEEESTLPITGSSKVIIAVAGKEDQEYIRTFLEVNKHISPFWFC